MSAENNAAEPETTCPAANLKAYAASAVLPKMDRLIHLADGEKPSGDFWIDTTIHRALDEVRQLDSGLIEGLARKYPIPAEAIPEPSLLALNALAVPGRNHPRGNPKTLARFEGMVWTNQDVGHWVDQVVLNTVRAMLNLIHPSDGWVAVPQRRSPIRAAPIGPRANGDIIECEVNILRRQIPDLGIFQTHLVVFTFPAWKVTSTDFWNFSMTPHLYPGLVGFLAEPCESSGLSRTDKMWYFIHDTCMMHNCRWFAITSVDDWGFGSFRAGWETAYASPSLSYCNRSPTILQVLILWTMSSLHENDPENPFVLSLRRLDQIRAGQSYIEGVDGLVFDTITYETYIRHSWQGAHAEIDESDSEEGTISSAVPGVFDGTPNNESFVTQLGDEAHGEVSSTIVVQDQPGPPPADHPIFPQATLDSLSLRARGSHRFSPYPLPSSREPLSPTEESAGTSGNTAAGPSRRVDKGKGRTIDTATTDHEEALPTISGALTRTVSALGSVLSLAFRTKPSATQNVRTVEKWRGKVTPSAEETVLNGATTAGPSGCGRSSSSPSMHPIDSKIPAPGEPLRSGNSFLEHRSPVVTGAPSSPVAGPSSIRQGEVFAEEGEDVADATE